MIKKILQLPTIVLLSLFLAACGGGGGAAAPSVIPEAQAATVDGCPTGDEAAQTAQLQAVLDSARGSVTLPACTFNVKTLRVSKPMRISCAGANVDGTVIKYSGDEGLVVDPAVVVNIATGGWDKRGFWYDMTDCRIQPQIKGGGKHDFVMRVRPGFFISSSYIARNHFGGAGAQGVYLDNSAGNLDGIFTTTFEKNFIENGVLAVNIGDSVHFIDNVVPDGANKPGLPGFDLSFVQGAAETALVRNNVTTSGGCVLVRNGIGLVLAHNWCEPSSTPPASVQGVITLMNCSECAVRDTRVQTLGSAVPYALVIDGGNGIALDSNKFNTGRLGHIAFVNGTYDNLLVGLNRYDGSPKGRLTGADKGLLSTP